MIESLEWLRPAWLLALPAGAACLWAWWRTHASDRPWRAHVDPELLARLAGSAPAGESHSRATSAHTVLAVAAALLVLVCAGLAGPVWRAQPASPQRDSVARVVVLDLSPSMDAVDVAPSRLERARAASAALLREAEGAPLGLVVFGADAFTVAPLTSDPAPLVHLLAGLGPATLPRAGSRPDLGLDMARAMLDKAGVTAGEVFLVGDSAGDGRALEAARSLADAGFRVSVLAVGTAHGGPVPLASGAFARDDAGETRIVRPDLAGLERVARAGSGRFRLLPAHSETSHFAPHAVDGTEPGGAPAAPTKARPDEGAWFALLALPFAALLFRRGWLACLAPLALTLLLPQPQALAFDWQDLWRRADQQAAAAFARGGSAGHARALDKLPPESPWRGMLLYRAGRFAEAAAQFAAQDTADAHYNRGNALALDNQLEAALAAYAAALQRDPGMPNALANRALVREALARRGPPPPEGGEAPERPDAAASRGGPKGSAGRGDWGAEFALAEALREARERARAQEAARQAGNARGSAELRRLEALLVQVPDDPKPLLASRFARHLGMRGMPHDDTGGRW
jgi:Ca-activated chloride channel family protein